MRAESRKAGCRRGHHSSGFSLVELMVALAIGLLVTLGAFQIFFSGKQSFEQISSLSERQETLRFLVDTLSYDIRSAESFSIAADQESLIIHHVDRPGNSMCPSDADYSVEYYENGGSIYLNPSCSTADALVIGVGAIDFIYMAGNYGVLVTVTLVDDSGRLNDENVSFMVANRSRVSEVIEF